MNGETRFILADSFESGVVEVCINSVWRPLCFDGFESADAEVVCTSMGMESQDGSKLYIYHSF